MISRRNSSRHSQYNQSTKSNGISINAHNSNSTSTANTSTPISGNSQQLYVLGVDDNSGVSQVTNSSCVENITQTKDMPLSQLTVDKCDITYDSESVKRTGKPVKVTDL